MLFSTDSNFSHFKGKFSVIKLSVSIFGQTAVYRIFTVSREPIRLSEIQYVRYLIVDFRLMLTT